MDFNLEHGNFNKFSIPLEDHFLIKDVVLTHNPDDRLGLDSEMLLHLLECTFCSATDDAVLDVQQVDAVGASATDLVGSAEPISLITYKVSNEILSKCFEGENLHNKTMALLETLSRYRWDTKAVLVLASFACTFGLFRLVLQLQSENALAYSLAMVKRLPGAATVTMLRPEFKALNLLVKTSVKLTRTIVRLEGMFLQHIYLDDNAMDIAVSKIYMATYWIFRSVLVCSSQIADSRNLILEQVYSDKSVIAAMGLYSLRNKLNNLFSDLDKFQQQIDTRFYDKLLHMFEEKQRDNQSALRTLFAMHNEFPFKNPSSGEKCGILELKNKVVLLLLSKPDLLPMDKLFFLVQQTRTDENYAVLWVPISSTFGWSHDDKTTFGFLSNCLPWLSILWPWSLNLLVIKYIKQEWNFQEDPMMVVLNENGIVTNTNALDMVWIWGPKAFPFSNSRETELWEEENWSLDLIINGINPLLSEWVEQGKNLCIYGSVNLDWIKEFNATIKKIRNAGIELEVVYVGCKNPGENVKSIIETIDQENLSDSLTFTKVNFFWFRLESMKRLISDCQNRTTKLNKIGQDLAKWLDFKTDENWSVISQGGSTDLLELDLENLGECVARVPLLRKNVAAMGLVGAIRSALEGPFGGEKCKHVEMVPYEEGLIEKSMICGLCNRLVENKFVLYKCEQ